MPYWINIHPHKIDGSTAKYRPFEDFREVCWQADLLRKRGLTVMIITIDGREIDETIEKRQLANMRVRLEP